MTDAISPFPDAADRHVGQLLQAARLAAGLDIAVLAAVLKVPVTKLEALERHELTAVGDVTFVRTLTKSVCRHLGVDSTPMLDRLPTPSDVRLSVSSQSLETPYRPNDVRGYNTSRVFGSRLVWGVLGIVLLTALLAFVPSQWVDDSVAWWEDITTPTPVPSPVEPPADNAGVAVTEPVSTDVPAAAVAPVLVLPGDVAPVSPNPSEPISPAANSSLAVSPAPAPNQTANPPQPQLSADQAAAQWLQLTASAEAWVELTDRSGKVLVQRLMKPGDSLGSDAPAPVRVVVGNARAVALTVKGQAFDLAPHTKSNVARVTIE